MTGDGAIGRLLIGFDGSDGGRDALELGRLLASRDGASVLVVTVMPYDPLPIAVAELEREAAERADPLLDRARERLSGLEVETRAFGGGSPAGIIADVAERQGVDLVVIGSSHRSAVGRALAGSVGHGLLHGSPCPVAVAPKGYAEWGEGPPETIGVAYDGTPESKAALGYARRLAEDHDASVRVLTAVAPPVALPGVVGYTPVNPPRPEQVVEEGVDALGPQLDADGTILEGPPAETLAQACEDGIDLLVTGSRGYGSVTQVLLGSVTGRLITIAPTPVLVVPRP